MRRVFQYLLLILISIISVSQAQQSWRVGFKLYVFIDSVKAPIHTIVEVRDVNGSQYDSQSKPYASPIVSEVETSLGTAFINALGDNPNTSTVQEGGFTIGQKIYFYVNSKRATVKCKSPSSNCDLYTNPSDPTFPPSQRELEIYISSQQQTIDTCTFTGSVFINNAPAPAGSQISFHDKNNPTTYTWKTIATSSLGSYTVKIAEDDPETTGKQGPLDGDTLIARINNLSAGSDIPLIFRPGQTQMVSLSYTDPDTLLCTFNGMMCMLDGQFITSLVTVEAFNKYNKVCGAAIGTSTPVPGSFTLNVRKEKGDNTGVVEGDSVYFKFNGGKARTTTMSPTLSPFFCYEDSSYMVVLEATTPPPPQPDTNFFMQLSGTLYAGGAVAKRNLITVKTSGKTMACTTATNDNGQFILKAWGDSPLTTDVVEGFEDEDTLTFYHLYNGTNQPVQMLYPTTPITYELFGLIANIMIYNSIVDIEAEETLIKSPALLLSNIPNPFNPGTNIRFNLTERTNVQITIFNVLGNEIRRLSNQLFPAGEHQLYWNGCSDQGEPQSAGIYFVRLRAADMQHTQKITLMK